MRWGNREIWNDWFIHEININSNKVNIKLKVNKQIGLISI